MALTDRRSFFRSLAILGAAAAGCPWIFVPKFEPVRWKPVRCKQTWRLNPNYITAEYEVYFYNSPALFDKAIFHKHETTIEPHAHTSLPNT